MNSTPDSNTGVRSKQREQRIAESVEMFRAGQTMADISRHFGITREMTRLDLLRAGITFESKRIKRIEDVERLAAEGLTAPEIAVQLGISISKVRDIARWNEVHIAASRPAR